MIFYNFSPPLSLKGLDLVIMRKKINHSKKKEKKSKFGEGLMFKTLYLKYSFVINFILGLLNYLELRSVVQGC